MDGKWLTVCGLLAALAAAALVGAAPPAKDSGQLAVTAHSVPKAPQGLEDPVWKRFPAAAIPVAGRLELADVREIVETRVLYTPEEIFFLLSWPDPTRSVVKQTWRYDGEKWTHLPGDEDRLALLFEIERIHEFSSRSCAVVCHSPPDTPRSQWKLATRTPAERGDLWHWKAARSAPYGCADDGWLTVAGNPTGSYRETGRRYDTGAGGDVRNETADGSRPRYMLRPGRSPAVPGVLLYEEAVEIPADAVFRPGDEIPYRLPLRPGGSRYDVKAESRHADGRWKLLLRRKLVTGHEDDVVFDPRRRYSFAIAVFDDSGADHSKTTRSLVLVFGR